MVTRMAETEAQARALLESPSTTAVFVPDHVSIGEFILSERMRDVTAEVARDIAELAKSTAKRDNKDKRNVHHYADGFYVVREGGTMVVDRAARVMVLVANDDPVALYNEFGNRKSKRLRTLGRAGAAYGDFKPDGGLST